MSGNDDEQAFFEVLPKSYLFSWMALCILLIISPCLANRRFRRVCWRRIHLLRWNVPTDDIDENEREHASTNHIFNSAFTPRYSPGDPRYIITNEQAEKMKKDYISDRLEGFSKIIEHADFSLTTDLEMGSSSSRNETRDDEARVEEEDDEAESTLDVKHDSCHNGVPQASNHSKSYKDKDTGDELLGLKCPSPGVPHTKTLCDFKTSSDKNIDLSTVPSEDSSSEHNCDHELVNIDGIRLIRPECSICLNEYKVGDRLCWSPNKNCPHAFHVECITKWLLTLGKEQNVVFQRDMSIRCDFKMQCPVCRGNFIHTSENATSEDEGVLEED